MVMWDILAVVFLVSTVLCLTVLTVWMCQDAKIKKKAKIKKIRIGFYPPVPEGEIALSKTKQIKKTKTKIGFCQSGTLEVETTLSRQILDYLNDLEAMIFIIFSMVWGVLLWESLQRIVKIIIASGFQ